MKQAYRAIKDALIMAHKLDRGMLPTAAASALLQAAQPFIAVLLSAFVLDRLAQHATFAQILPPVLGGVILLFAMNLANGWLDKYDEAHLDACYLKWEGLTGEKALALDYQQLDDPAVTSLLTRMKNDSNWGSGIANTYHYFNRSVNAAFGLVFSLILLAPLFQPSAFPRTPLSLVFILAALLLTASVVFYKLTHEKKSLKAYTDGTSSGPWKSLYYYLWGDFSYQMGKDIRIYKAQPLIQSSLYDPDQQTETRRNILRVSHATATGGALEGLCEALLQGGSYLFVVLMAAQGAVSVGMVVRLCAGLFELTQGLSAFTIRLSHFAVDTQRLQSKFEFLALPGALYKGTLTTEKRLDSEYDIEFHHVTFRYPGASQDALTDFSLKLRVGERLAVVGMNGSGKTTMIKLLCRLYDPTEGQITLNGIDIRKYDYTEYLALFSVVFQDFAIPSLPLGKVVAASNHPDPRRAADCLEKAGFGERLRALPKELDTSLYKHFDENGVDISGGEAQKIALARALYKNAPFIILDEPTAALDPIAEYDIYSRFDSIVGQKTAIYISHRLSSCRFCHDIAVFDGGRLIQRGSHDALLADAGGKYHQLWHAQAQYYVAKTDAS